MPEPQPEPGTVYFLSDYGHHDEFVGVVHAVLGRLVPGTPVIDLTHGIAPFDVRAGAGALARCLPSLGPGVVLAVVDPGVGGERGAVAVEAGPGPGPRWFVGPDNGLLTPALDAAGGAVRALRIDDPVPGATVLPEGDGATTFDGRDLFAPMAAALVLGRRPEGLGRSTPPADLVRLPPPLAEHRRLSGGYEQLRTEVTWVDHFGNAQLAAPARLDTGPDVQLVTRPGRSGAEAGALPVRRVRSFVELGPREVGLLADANRQLAVVVMGGSAALRLGLGEGDPVDLVWRVPEER